MQRKTIRIINLIWSGTEGSSTRYPCNIGVNIQNQLFPLNLLGIKQLELNQGWKKIILKNKLKVIIDKQIKTERHNKNIL